ncbi:class I SAM-dependent methyltransferase [bacterium]|jgi:2-polyprenyl-3-methyl-5-hydroxy-6-metoxy-1,4-benzoquinol methylase|nr:class I SAM-dependent methyltransferase [bacterium]MBT5015717.1 class I SAM-dependent methyltransferase [bacterium]
MKLTYKAARLPKNQALCEHIDIAAQRLYDKLSNFNFATINISDYNKNYLFQDHLSNLTRTLQKYSYILAWSLDATKLPLQDVVFMEYGGGVGILSLLAKEAGVGTVLYNDIYPVSCNDAQAIGKALGCEADHYIPGDIDPVIEYLKNHKISCNAVASYDVIEHVYNIEEFLQKLKKLSSRNSLSIFMSSGANTCNPRIKSALTKLHHQHEYEDRLNLWGHKKRDSLQSFYTIRKDIIRKYKPSLTKYQIDQLSRATRGMIQKDIHACIDKFKKTRLIPAEPTSSDTCDPHTGNWSEHLMDPYHLIEVLRTSGFQAQLVPGYYGHNTNTIKNHMSSALNSSISLVPALGIKLAPFYSLLATI